MANTRQTEKAAQNKGFLGALKSFFPATLGVVGLAGLLLSRRTTTTTNNNNNNNPNVPFVFDTNLLHGVSLKTKQVTGAPGAPGAQAQANRNTAAAQPTGQKITPFKGKYNYNAPMVSDAYFNPLPDISVDNALYGAINLEWYTHAANAWRSGKAAKGAFQMDRYLWNNKTVIDNINAADKKLGKKIPRDMRGFRFLYNPENVSMAWGANAYTNNQALLMGLSKINPVAPSTSASVISFSLFLNRIQDMSFINEEGLYYNPEYNYRKLDVVQKAQINKLLRSEGIKTPEATPPKPNVYPQDVSQSERKLIYEKGTMYDFEWLISTLNGFAFRDHVSDLNGRTNDMGFLMQFPVELHLGNRLRYRVQVTDINVQHIIFNTRMVPIWSKVMITCRRMPDYNLGTGVQDEQFDYLGNLVPNTPPTNNG